MFYAHLYKYIDKKKRKNNDKITIQQRHSL